MFFAIIIVIIIYPLIVDILIIHFCLVMNHCFGSFSQIIGGDFFSSDTFLSNVLFNPPKLRKDVEESMLQWSS